MNYVSTSLQGCLLAVILSLLFSSTSYATETITDNFSADAGDKPAFEAMSKQPFRYRLTNDQKVDGFKLSPSLYLAEAHLDNGRQWAILLDTGTVVYAINENHVSVSFRF